MTTRIANVKVRVPIYIDRDKTEALAAEVTERLRATESASDRIDTQAFALQVAFEFAAELDHFKQQHSEDEKEFVVALERIASGVKALLFRPAQQKAED